jgi:hypothetical protein
VLAKRRNAITAGAIAAIAFFWALTYAQPQHRTPRNKRPDQATQPQQTAAPDQRGTDQSPFIVKIPSTPESEAKAAEEADERREKAKLDIALVKFNGDLAFYTLILAIIAGPQPSPHFKDEYSG